MKKIVIAALIFAIGTVCFASDPLEGYWLSVDDKSGKVTGGWEIYQEGGRLYGRLLSSAEQPPDVIAVRCKESYRGFPVAGKVNQMRVVGTPWIFGLTFDRPGQWKDGNVVNPEDGNMYKCRLIFHAADADKYKTDTLEMRGEIGLGIGRSQFWRKTDRETASTLSPR
jgi:uncharacterized protein (DUF2147 family)